MDTLTQAPGSETSDDGGRKEFLPPESPTAMPTRPLHEFHAQNGVTEFALKSIWLRRACIFIGAAALTLAGCYEMYQVVQVGGVTILEWMVLALFVLLFEWIA